jgi:diguanylate cyclase (GGDEF)-like protein
VIDLRLPSSARSLPEFVDRVLEALVGETDATLVAYIDETHARRYAGRALWTEPPPPVNQLPSSLKVGRSSDFDAPWPDRPIANYALVPLRERGIGIFGWLYLLGGKWTGAQLEQIALSLAPIAQVVRDYADAYRLAMYDVLTGLPNEVLYQTTAQQWVAARVKFTIVFIDLNDFKQINDTHGHAEGDKALKVVSHALVHSGHPELDFVSRVHGDEFVVLLQETPADVFIERVREKIGPLGLSLSAGAASAEGLTLEEACHRADGAMYADKEAHRARTGRKR